MAGESRSFADRLTGATIHQITDHAAISHPTYFLQSSFLPGDRAMIFTSYRSGGVPQLFAASYPDGEIRQLTTRSPIHAFSPAIHRSGREVFFVRGGGVWSVGLREQDGLTAAASERQVVDFAGAQLGECSLSADGEWITAAIKQGSQAGLVAGKTDGSEWRLIPFPRTVIHPQFHPLEPEWMIFAGDPAPRMFRVRRDGSGMECLYEHGNDEFVVHETFLGHTGDIVFTVWPRALCRMNWHTKAITTIAEFNVWHIAPNRAGSKVLCDTNHPDRGIFVIDVESGEPQAVCASDSSSQGTQWRTSRYALAADFAAARSEASKTALSWMENATDSVYGPQWTHPHPSFSCDERKVAFASDRSGVTQAYVAEIPLAEL